MKSRPLERMSTVGMAILVLLLPSSCSQETPVLSIGSGGTLGNYYAVARAIARVVNQEQDAHGFLLQQEATTGSVANIDAILAGDVAFGIAQADREYQAVNGLADWKDRGPQKDLRAVFSLYTDSITVVATLASGIRTTRDLVGKRVDIGHPDSGSRQNAIDALDVVGIDWRKDIVVSGDDPDERTSKYLRGELDAFFHTVGHPTLDINFAVNSLPRARLIPLSNIEELLSTHPYYSRAVIPIGLYPDVGNEDDVETIGVKAILLTSAAVPDEVVYAITRAVFDGIESVGKFEPVLKTLSRTSMLEDMTVPLHSGALRYYEEAGLVPASSGQPD
jgi:TRAP transporter TAXI family solute receptor